MSYASLKDLGNFKSIIHVPTVGGASGRWIAVGSMVAPNTVGYYSDDDGLTWNASTGPTNLTWTGLTWTGNYLIAFANGASGGAGQVLISKPPNVGTVWQAQGSSGASLGKYSASVQTSANVVVQLGQPLSTFFDTMNGRSFGWTTYDVHNGNVDGPSASSVFATFRFELTDASSDTSYTHSNEGVSEVNTLGNHFPVVVDNLHRAWSIGTRGYQTKYSQLTWNDSGAGYPFVGTPAVGGLPNSEVISDGYDVMFAAADSKSGIMVAGLCDDTMGASTEGNILAATALYGSEAGDNEFPTYGAQIGPATIRPVLPLLDDIYAWKLTDDNVGALFSLAANRGNVVGFRPGLRNTEAHGEWEFLFGCAAPHTFDPSNGYVANERRGIWVRQMRLETVINSGVPLFFQNPQRARLFSKPAHVDKPEGLSIYSIQSGSAAWDVGLVVYQKYRDADYGRSVSITSDKSSLADSYSVMTFITGTLYDKLVASGVANPTSPEWFLNGNGFGTPYIPDSYMQIGTGSAEQVDQAAAQEIFNNTVNIQTLVPGANDMPAYLSRQAYASTTADNWEETIASQTSGSSSYWPPSPP